MVYRAGLIGCGGVSKNHAAALRAARNVALVALADVYEPNLKTAGAAYGVDRLYTDYRRMIQDERLDIVNICTQAPQHAPVVIGAVEAGVRGIICEKPIGVTLSEADAMVAACECHGVRLAINHQTRMIPNTFAVERLVRGGAIGELRAARMIDKGGRPAGNSLMEMLTHMFDLLRTYAGDPAWVSAHLTVGEGGDHQGPQRLATVDDIMFSQEALSSDRDCGLVLGDRCSASFGFAPRSGWHNGMTAALESYYQPRRSAGPAWGPTTELLGTDGVLFLGGTSTHVDVHLHRGPWAAPGLMESQGDPVNAMAPGPVSTHAAMTPHHIAMVEELVAAIEEGRQHRSSGHDGRWALEMIMGVYESHRRDGARVAVPLEHRDHPLERWLTEVGRPLPVKPDRRVKTLQAVPAEVRA